MVRHSRLTTVPPRIGLVLRLALILVAVLGMPRTSFAAEPIYRSSVLVVRVGHWIDATGKLAEDGTFVAEKVELFQPQEDLLTGVASEDEPNPRRFLLVGLVVTTDAKTHWRGLEPGQIKGVRIKVEGAIAADGSFRARAIAERDPGREHVGGRVDALDVSGGAPIARVLGVRVRLPAEIEHQEPLDAIAEAPDAGSRGDGAARDEDDLFGEGVALGRSLRLTGQLQLDGTSEQELDLDAEEDEDREFTGASARLRLDWQPLGGRISGAVEGRGAYVERFGDAGNDSTSTTTLGEAYLAFAGVAGRGSELVVGRQDFDDEREWIYDQNLDALRLLWRGERVRFELSASTTAFDGALREEAATNYIALFSNADRKRRLAAWIVHRDFDLATAERTTHAGVRATGRWLPASQSWLDVALFRGSRGAVDLEGWGFDVGTTARPRWLGPFSFTVGYAFGSGGEVSAEKDRTFRQTGFHDNNAKFAGVTSFRYYGELVDPELANLRVVTAGIGVRFATKSSLDLVWHGYEQDSVRRRLVDTELDRRPDGVHADLGWEADLVLGSRELPWFDLEIVAAYFSPGAAFPADAQEALLGKIQMRFRF